MNSTDKDFLAKELDVVATPRVRVTQRDPVVIEATYALRPTVKLGDYKGLKLEQEKIDITEEQVDDLANSAGSAASMAEIQQKSLQNQIQFIKKLNKFPILHISLIFRT